MLLKRKKKQEREHEEIGERFEALEQEQADMARRVHLLEIEAGIYKGPKLKEANGS